VSKSHYSHHPLAKRGLRLRFLLTQKRLYGRPTDGTGPFHGVPAIFHGDLLRVLHFGFLLALDAIGFSHLSLSFLSTERVLRAHSCSLILTVAQKF
jgi:hypothetical protein